jgi:hypothetical protein
MVLPSGSYNLGVWELAVSSSEEPFATCWHTQHVHKKKLWLTIWPHNAIFQKKLTFENSFSVQM